MKTSTVLQLILGCLLHTTLGGASDPCFKGKVLPINIPQINGLWNLKALGARPTLTYLTVLNKVQYSYAKIFLTEKEGTITEFFNPIEGITDEPIHFQRVDSEKEKLTYRKDNKEAPELLIFIQPDQDVLIVNRQSNGILKTSALYVRSKSHPESKLDEFREWSKCKELTFFKNFDNTEDYAQKCYGLLEAKTPLHLEEAKEDVTSWHLVAKSSTSMDQHYNVRILYTARLEINRKEHTFKEIITAPNDNVVFEMKIEEPTKDGHFGLNFETEDGLLLMGVQTNTGRTLYLASKTPTVQQFYIDKFKVQALCFESKFNYFIPGRVRGDDGDDVCSHHLEKWESTNHRGSTGKWILMASAYKNMRTAVTEQLLRKTTAISVVNDKMEQSITLQTGSVTTSLKTPEIDVIVEEGTGNIVFIDFKYNKTSIHNVNPNCNIFSYEERRLLNCRENHLPSIGDIIRFAQFAACQHFNKILIHQSLSSLCSETPPEVPALDVEKIAGRWRLVAAACDDKERGEKFPYGIEFIVKNGKVSITDGTWTSEAKKIGNNGLQYTKGRDTMEMRFYEPLGDSLLIKAGNSKKTSLALFSKFHHARLHDFVRFKHFAACLSIPVTFMKE